MAIAQQWCPIDFVTVAVGEESEEKNARSRVNDLVVLSEASLAAARRRLSTRRAQEP
jgi:hypothetical protein